MEQISLRELCYGKLKGGSITGHAKGYVKKAPETVVCPYGGSVGPPGAGSFTRDFERRMMGCCGIGASHCEGNLKGSTFTGGLNVM